METVKKKKVTYLLIAAVAIVWGIIIYQFISRMLVDDVAVLPQATPAHETYDQYEPKPDTFKLALNYRDPFSGKVTTAAETIKKEIQVLPSANAIIKPVVPPLNWAGIKYSGYIINPKTKSLVSILTVEGKERMIAEGESLQGVKLLKNKRDSVLLSWKGKQKYIRQ